MEPVNEKIDWNCYVDHNDSPCLDLENLHVQLLLVDRKHERAENQKLHEQLRSIQQERDQLERDVHCWKDVTEQYKEQVNTLKKFLRDFRERTPYGLYQDQIDNVLQSIKEEYGE